MKISELKEEVEKLWMQILVSEPQKIQDAFFEMGSLEAYKNVLNLLEK